ncbi:MAG TPA: 3-oxoacyl-[acyl-carrier-protein] synthase III C-terminal domain-containing protein [Ignavibacteria bacterium]|nr:type III polyketide synthase [Bacteroidota bacterium]HRI83993.1 3-oxoacyl-[acyl-carrier-protein] synthase III C-terminal domain-containing protein [Ignavibacteria bacterium]HRJ99190.1 3-oxoacyl-[acyl-carrier-protein] synthase III C-terminal domain-containing protein [Ignavibacteria bacterium]
MSEIITVSKTDMPYKILQSEMKKFADGIFRGKVPDAERLMSVFENSEIDERNLCVPLEYFNERKSFAERNSDYLKLTIDYSVTAIKDCLLRSGFSSDDITDIIFISSTGISTPSPDAFIINQLKLNKNINRYPVWGLGCAGGVAGIAKAKVIADSNPNALVALVTSELCSLTFLNDDFSKSNLVATSLFSDGVAAVLIKGDGLNFKKTNSERIEITDAMSRIYYDSTDVMGWEVTDAGLKVIFSKDIPTIVEDKLKPDIEMFLKRNDLKTDDIKNFVTHPGGIKVIDSYVRSLEIDPCNLDNTKYVLRKYGNMSSATVMYVLDRFICNGFTDGFGIMTSLGPGFSSEMVLLNIQSK